MLSNVDVMYVLLMKFNVVGNNVIFLVQARVSAVTSNMILYEQVK
jgi:hypothetical protein